MTISRTLGNEVKRYELSESEAMHPFVASSNSLNYNKKLSLEAPLENRTEYSLFAWALLSRFNNSFFILVVSIVWKNYLLEKLVPRPFQTFYQIHLVFLINEKFFTIFRKIFFNFLYFIIVAKFRRRNLLYSEIYKNIIINSRLCCLLNYKRSL